VAAARLPAVDFASAARSAAGGALRAGARVGVRAGAAEAGAEVPRPVSVEEFVQNAEAAGFTVHRGPAPEIEGAGVSRALYGLADTGSVVLAASPEEPRTNSLLPASH